MVGKKINNFLSITKLILRKKETTNTIATNPKTSDANGPSLGRNLVSPASKSFIKHAVSEPAKGF